MSLIKTFASVSSRWFLFVSWFPLLIGTVEAQNVDLEWATHFGGTGSEYSKGITVDQFDKVYALGTYNGTVDFNPGSGTYNLSSAGDGDLFIQKSHSNGALIWAKSIGGPYWDKGTSICADNQGNTYVLGEFEGVLDFDPNAGNASIGSSGGLDVFILKLDPFGQFVWVKKIGGSGDDYGVSMVMDDSENIYITGYFNEETDFDPSEGELEFTSNGHTDIFVEKLNPDGNIIWAKQMGGAYHDYGQAVGLDDDGNVYVAGHYENTADFDPGIEEFNMTSVGGDDLFVMKLDNNGDFEWSKSMGGNQSDYMLGLAVDASGNAYTIGLFEGTSDFDPSVNEHFFIAEDGFDGFVHKLDTDGEFEWAHQMIGSEFERINSVDVDESGHLYVTGYFSGSLDFDPGPDEYELTSFGYNDAFVQKLNNNGELIWAIQSGGVDGCEGKNIHVDEDENVYVMGVFNGSSDFNPGIDTLEYSTFGLADLFVQKFSQCSPSEQIPSQLELPVIVSQCPVVLSAPTAFDGCDTLVGTTETTFPIYDIGTTSVMWTYEDRHGITSSQTQEVVIEEDTTYPVFEIEELPSFVARCELIESIIAPPLAQDNCAGTLEGIPDVAFPIEFGTNNHINWTFDDGNGNVVSQTQDIIWEEIDASIALDGVVITSNNPNAEYQWLDCETGASIFGENNQSYTALVNGSYAVELTENGCTSVSDCVEIMSVGLADAEINSGIEVYPNPSNGLINVAFPNSIDKAELTVSNIQGQEVLKQFIQHTDNVMLDLTVSPGLYFLSIQSVDAHQIFTLVIK